MSSPCVCWLVFAKHNLRLTGLKRTRAWIVAGFCLTMLMGAAESPAADNVLTDQERKDGWLLLFDGNTLQGWKTSDSKPSEKPVEDHCINPHGCGAYMMVYEKPWENFTLSLDFKISKGCNSGVFLRTNPLKSLPDKDVGYNGIEVQILDSSTASMYDTGAIYDLAAPSKNAMKPAGEWNHYKITCDKASIAVELNGEKVSEIHLDDWTVSGKRPDGTSHKFDRAFKDHPRSGYIGLQDHGGDCWFKNIKLLPLK